MDMSRIAILLTAHPKQQKWWAAVLLALERYPGPLVLAYDDQNTECIPGEILSRFEHVVVTGEPAGAMGHGKGELVCLLEGFRAIAKLPVDYCLKLGFDEPPWRWRNLAFLAEQLETEHLDCIHCKTRVIFGRPQALLRVMELYDVRLRDKGSAESHWQWAMREAKLHHYCNEDRIWWERTLGLLHLQGEYAANIGQPNKWSWMIGELWPRVNKK